MSHYILSRGEKAEKGAAAGGSEGTIEVVSQGTTGQPSSAAALQLDRGWLVAPALSTLFNGVVDTLFSPAMSEALKKCLFSLLGRIISFSNTINSPKALNLSRLDPLLEEAEALYSAEVQQDVCEEAGRLSDYLMRLSELLVTVRLSGAGGGPVMPWTADGKRQRTADAPATPSTPAPATPKPSGSTPPVPQEEAKAEEAQGEDFAAGRWVFPDEEWVAEAEGGFDQSAVLALSEVSPATMSRASGEEGNATQSIANDTFDSGALTPEPLTKQKSSLEQSESWPSWVDSFASVVAVFKALQSRSSLPAALIEEQWKALRDEHMGSFLLVMRGLPAVGAAVPDTRIASPSTPGSPRPTPKPSTPAGGKEEKQEKEGKKPSTVTAQHVIDAVQAILQDQGLRVAQQHSIRLVKDMESEAGKGTAALIRIIDDRRLSRVMGKLQGSTHNLQMVEPSIDMSFKISVSWSLRALFVQVGCGIQ